MASILTDILKDLNFEKQNLFKVDAEQMKKEFHPYVINRFLKSHIDCIMEVQMMNLSSHLDKEIQYDFYIHALPKKKRFSKYLKSSKADDDIKCIMKYYTYSRQKAEEVYGLLSDDQMAQVIKKCHPPKGS